MVFLGVFFLREVFFGSFEGDSIDETWRAVSKAAGIPETADVKAQVPSPTPKASAPMTSDSTVFVGYMSRRMNIRMVMNWKSPNSQSAEIVSMRTDELYEAAKKLEVPYDLVQYVHENHRLPVVNFAAGGVATPADAALMMQLGAEGVFVGSGIFKSGDPAKRAAAIVQATTNYNDADLVAKLSEGLGEAMVGINEQEIAILMVRLLRKFRKVFCGLSLGKVPPPT